MGFQINIREGRAGEKTGEIYELIDDTKSCRAEIWPFMGFNCLKWQVRNPDGEWGNILYTAPDWEINPVPTRSGHPILFPFPNRIEQGQFSFEGKRFQLPLNESTGKHAIHGFTPRNAWRVIDQKIGNNFASLTGQFCLSKDLPAALPLWPSDCSITLEYHLTATMLSVHVLVENVGDSAMPFGLGYHPYFCVPTVSHARADDMILYCPAGYLWSAQDGIPTGDQCAVPERLAFPEPRVIGDVQLDCLYGDLQATEPDSVGCLPCMAQLRHPSSAGVLMIRTDRAFRELLVFIPPHRNAVAIEPYTCASNAPNLTDRGIDAGWQVLRPGCSWKGQVEYQWEILP